MGAMQCVVPGCGNVRKLGMRRDIHDKGCNGNPKCRCGPGQSGRVATLRLAYSWGVVSGIEPKQRYVDDPDAVKVDKQLPKRALLVIRLEECTIPVDAVETHQDIVLAGYPRDESGQWGSTTIGPGHEK